MGLFLAGLAVLLLGGCASLALGRAPRAATLAGAGSAILGCLFGLGAAILALARGAVSLRLAWDVPYGSFFVELDGLSAWFLLPLFGLSALAALYGAEYLWGSRDRKSLGPPWFFFNLLVASLAMVMAARNGVLFLVAWEVMSLASFFLVTFEDDREEVRQAGWTYLVAAHLGTAFLFAFFILLGRGGTLDFDRLGAAPGGAVFLLALVGFGTKAGLMPFHVWLPEAHPAAPSHVSALMSGVMIKAGIYGLLRSITLLGPPPAWWGWTLVGIGAASAVLGVLSALAQHDLKRVLAYSTVENAGLMAMAIGLGLIGMSAGSPAVTTLGFSAALLHVLNHAVGKGLLFMGAGSVLHATGTRRLDHLGGLLKKMPWTGATFILGAASLVGLPPFGGFASEFLAFFAAFQGVVSFKGASAVPPLAAAAALALAAGLAAACFARALGTVFLGEPRSAAAGDAHEPHGAMKVPMVLLGAGGILLGIASPFLLPALPAIAGPADPATMDTAARGLARFVAAASLFFAVLTALVVLRRALLAGRRVDSAGTWDCGYARPSARMQYTASSFAQPILDPARPILAAGRDLAPPAGHFPAASRVSTRSGDPAREAFYQPAFRGAGWAISKLRWIQAGRVHLYVLYIALTLLVLLAWKLS